MATIAAPGQVAARATLGEDVRDAGQLLLVGAAAGALAGGIVGGLGGRLVMLVLRLTSDPIVIGATSDDGFEIGRVTFGGTLGLAAGMAAAGTVNGALYVVLRDSIPRRLRAALWPGFAAVFVGSQVIHKDGIDFTMLEPLWFAVAAFVLLPGLAALTVVLLVERWLGDTGRRPHAAALAVAAALGTVGLVLGGALAVAMVVARQLGVTGALARLGRVVVPAGLAVGIAVAGWYVADEAVRILG